MTLFHIYLWDIGFVHIEFLSHYLVNIYYNNTSNIKYSFLQHGKKPSSMYSKVCYLGSICTETLFANIYTSYTFYTIYLVFIYYLLLSLAGYLLMSNYYSYYYHYFIYLSSTILYYASHVTLSLRRHSSIEVWRMRLISVSK